MSRWNLIFALLVTAIAGIVVREKSARDFSVRHFQLPQQAQARAKANESMMPSPTRRGVGPIRFKTDDARENANSLSVDERNAEIFAREELLRQFSRHLQKGMNTNEVIRTLGNPWYAYHFVTNGWEITCQRISFGEQGRVPPPTFWVYSPNHDDSFSWNGTMYQELTIEFDPALSVAALSWHIPIGSLRMKIQRP